MTSTIDFCGQFIVKLTFTYVKHPNINHFTFNPLLFKINSIKINYSHRRIKHSLNKIFIIRVR